MSRAVYAEEDPGQGRCVEADSGWYGLGYRERLDVESEPELGQSLHASLFT